MNDGRNIKTAVSAEVLCGGGSFYLFHSTTIFAFIVLWPEPHMTAQVIS